MVRVFLAGCVVLISAHTAMAQQVEADFRDCVSAASQDSRIEACTRIIDNPTVQGRRVGLAFIERGRAHYLKNELNLALIDLDQAVEALPNNYRSHFERALVHYEKRNYEATIRDYDSVLRIDPQNISAHANRGLAFEKAGNREQARASYDNAIRIRPAAFFALMRRGYLTASKGDYEGAIRDYDASIAAEPRQLMSRVYRAEARERLGLLQPAIDDYQAVIDAPSVRAGVKDDAYAKRVAPTRLSLLQKKIAAGSVRTAPEKRVALVIGNSGYAHAGVLKNPESDAKAVAKALRDVGFTDVRERFNMGLGELVRELKEFGDLASEADWAVIYYSGHGVETGGANYLVPIDAKLDQPGHVEDEAMPLSRVLSKVAGAGKLQMVILDACRTNPFAAKLQKSGRLTRAITRGLIAVEPDSGTLLVYASRDGTVALDGEGANSPFAEALVAHMVEPGLEINLLFRKVRDSVMQKTGRQQEPFTYGSLPAQELFFKAR